MATKTKKTATSKSDAKNIDASSSTTTTTTATPIAPVSVSQVAAGLEETGYIPTRQISFATASAINYGVPLLLEGAAGVGKTQLAKATAKMLGVPLIRAQFYEGLTADQLLFDYDYQKQLLTIQAISASLSENLSGKTISGSIEAVSDINFYSEQFLIARPLLKSITEGRCVLLLDEVDKSSEEMEYALLEFLENYSISVPQLGTVECPQDARPVVFLTSNRYRDLSDALKRRCGYLYIPKKSEKEMEDILLRNASADPAIASAVAKVVYGLTNKDLRQSPSVAEAIDWANMLEGFADDVSVDISDTLSSLLKNEGDREWVEKHSDTLSPIVSAWSKVRAEKYGL